jgi:hypothetical protein
MRSLFISLAFIMLYGNVAAQNKFGLSFGGNIGFIAGPADSGATAKPGSYFQYGINNQSKISKRFTINTGVYYSQKSVSFSQPVKGDTIQEIAYPLPNGTTVLVYVPATYAGIVDGSIKLSCIEVPISVGYYITKSFMSHAGIQIGYILAKQSAGVANGRIGESDIYYSTKYDESYGLNDMNIEFKWGFMKNFSKHVSIDASSYYGLSRIFKKSHRADKFYTVGLQAGVHYWF